MLGQKLLEAVFGDQAVRGLAERARRDLERRVDDLLDAERRRYTDLLDGLGIDAAGPRPRCATPPAGSRTCGSPRAAPDASHHSGSPDPIGWTRTAQLQPRENMTALLEGAKKLVARGPTSAPGSRDSTRPPTRARGRLDDAVVDEAREAADRAAGRIRLSADHTVVAIAGATGSGKSSTFNWLTGLDLSAVGVRRPDHVVGDRLRVGERGRRPSCSSGSASRRGTR